MTRFSRAPYEKRPLTPAIGAAIWATFMAAAASITLVFQILPPEGWSNDASFSADILWIVDRLIANAGFPYRGYTFEAVRYALDDTLWDLRHSRYDLRDQTSWRFRVVGPAMLIAFCITGPIAFLRTPFVDTRVHYKGRRLLTDRAAVASANTFLQPDINKHGQGMLLTAGVHLSRMRELRNLLIVGAPNSGKTRIVLFLIEQILRQLHKHPQTTRALIHDTTGEIYRGLPLGNEEFAFLHAQRPDGWAWAMGPDIRNLADAGSLAERLINPQGPTPGQNRVFDDGGVTCLTGYIVLTRVKHGKEWGAVELLETLLEDPIVCRERMKRFYPAAAALMVIDPETGGLNRTSASFILTLQAHVLKLLDPLARTWGKIPRERRFSFVDWLNGKGDQPAVVLLQRSARYAELSSLWIGTVLDLIASHACDEGYNDDKRMRCHLVLDEVHQLGPLKRYQEILDTGRNKNISTIAAFQDFAQMRITHGRDGAQAFRGRFATTIIGQMPIGPDTAEVSNEVIKTRSILPEAFKPGEKPRPEDVLIVDEDIVAERLGVIDDEVRAIVSGLGNVVELAWPVTVWERRR